MHFSKIQMESLLDRLDTCLKRMRNEPIGIARMGLLPVVIEAHLKINSPLAILGEGDNGIVLLGVLPDKKQYAIKVFKEYTIEDDTKTARNWIMKDQVHREFLALSMLNKTEHPNFPRIYSEIVDTYEMKNEYTESDKGLAIRMELIQNTIDIKICSKMIGLKYERDMRHLSFEFDRRNQNLEYMILQVISAVKCLETLKIHHRDLDACNILVRLPDLQVFIVDFSRADFGPENHTVLEPKEILKQTQFQMEGNILSTHLSNPAMGLKQGFNTDTVYKVRDIFSRNYANIYSDTDTGNTEPTDKEGLIKLLDTTWSISNVSSIFMEQSMVQAGTQDPKTYSVHEIFESENQLAKQTIDSIVHKWDSQPTAQKPNPDRAELNNTINNLVTELGVDSFKGQHINATLRTVESIVPSQWLLSQISKKQKI